MKIGFFWGPEDPTFYSIRWSLRGFYFEREGSRVNVHYTRLLGLYGSNWKIKLLNFKRAWKTVFTLGRS